MKVSIVVTNRNYGKFLPDCLESIANQTYENIEVLLSDGKSTDGSVEIFELYSKRYGWKIFSYADNGQAEAISKGMSIASGDIFCWLNSDDIFLSNRSVEKMVQYFEDMESVDIVSLGGFYIDEIGRFIDPVRLVSHPLLRQRDLIYRGGFLQPATFWRRKVSEQIQIDLDLRYCFDSDFFLRASQKFNLLINQNDYIAGYRLHSNNLSLGVKSERIRETSWVTQKFFGKGFRSVYLNCIAFLVCVVERLPGVVNKVFLNWIYVLVNSLSYITVYRLPGI